MPQDAFETLARTLRPRLHRYCARMLGSAFEGEDVVQDALVKAAAAWSSTGEIDRPDAWLLRIAHNTALDALRRRKRQAARQAVVELDGVADMAAAADARVAASASLAAFMPLSATERSSVILVDVLGDSLEETAAVLGATLAAVKAALHRGRARLRAVTAAGAPTLTTSATLKDEKLRLRNYADRFNARDFDALRRLLAEDVTLDLAGRTRLAGRKDVSVYFHRYEERSDWRFAAVLADGRPALLGVNPDDGDDRWVVLLDWRGAEIAAIRDFRFATYVTDALTLSPLGEAEA